MPSYILTVRGFDAESPNRVVFSYEGSYNSVKINLSVPNAPFLYPMEALENLTVFWCFQGVEKGCIENKWVKVKTLGISVIEKLNKYRNFSQRGGESKFLISL